MLAGTYGPVRPGQLVCDFRFFYKNWFLTPKCLCRSSFWWHLLLVNKQHKKIINIKVRLTNVNKDGQVKVNLETFFRNPKVCPIRSLMLCKLMAVDIRNMDGEDHGRARNENHSSIVIRRKKQLFQLPGIKSNKQILPGKCIAILNRL